MKRLLTILLMLCISAQSMAQVVVIGLFELNKGYIAKNLCENRAKPQSTCCGKCYLRKQLKKTEADDKPSGNAPAKLVKAEVLPCILPGTMLPPAPVFEGFSPAVQTPVEKPFHDLLRATAIFHPPA